MPQYSYFCGKKHLTERVAPMSKIPKRVRCAHPRCKLFSKLGLSVSLDTFVRNRVMSDKTRSDLRWAFGKKKAGKMRTTADVDAGLRSFASRYPHLQDGYVRGRKYDPRSDSDMKSLGTPHFKLGDPFTDSEAPISDDGRNNREVRER